MRRLITIASIALSLHAHASSSWIESIDGELSGNANAPTFLNFQGGSNFVSGVVGGADTYDFFSFTIPTFERLTAIYLHEYIDVGSGGDGFRGFMHIDAGLTTVFPDIFNASDLLGASHVDRGIVPSSSFNVLDHLALGENGSSGFASPLAAGDYSFNIQQIGSELTAYEFEFVVTPAPSTTLVMALPCLTLARRRR